MPVRKTTSSSHDPRPRRSSRALASALVDLLHERHFDDITVQDILDRAGVGRATFYGHFRNKEDVLFSSYDGLFAHLEAVLGRDPPQRHRVLPVKEFLEHIGEYEKLVASLRASGKLDALLAVAVDHFARMIDRRIAKWRGAAGGKANAVSSLTGRMLASAFLEMMRWSADHPGRTTAAQLDDSFHDFALPIVRRLLV